MIWDYYGEFGCCLYCSHNSLILKGYKLDDKGNCFCEGNKCDKCKSYDKKPNQCNHSKFDSVNYKKNRLYFSSLLKKSEKAYLFKINDREIWFPKSQIVIKDNYVVVPYWLIREKNINTNKIVKKKEENSQKKLEDFK